MRHDEPLRTPHISTGNACLLAFKLGSTFLFLFVGKDKVQFMERTPRDL